MYMYRKKNYKINKKSVIQYCSISFMYFWGLIKKQRSCDVRGGARSAPVGVLMSPKRLVRGAHRRTRGNTLVVIRIVFSSLARYIYTNVNI
jgi:hypothetical protein